LGARILAVVDCFDALTSDRPYRTRLSDSEAITVLMQRRGIMYDPLIVDTFVAAKDELAESLTASLQSPNNVEGLLRQPIPASSASPPTAKPARVGASQPELQRAIRTVLVTAAGDLSASLTLVYLKDRARDELIAADALGAQADELIGSVLALGTRVSGWVAANGRPIINTDARLEFPTWAGLAHDTICAVLPIRSLSEVIGVLLVARTANSPFDSNEVNFLEKICVKFDEPPLSDLLGQASPSSLSQALGKRPIVH